MKKINIFYWICTGNLIPGLGIGSIYGIILHPGSTEQFVRLGYPVYLAPFLGVARILALIVIVIPKYPRLKEWAYAGLAFDIIGAIYSQIATGQSLTSLVLSRHRDIISERFVFFLSQKAKVKKRKRRR